MGLWDFYRKASEYVSPDPAALDQARREGERHAVYHRRIVWIAVALGGMGFLLGVGMMVKTFLETTSAFEAKEALAFPLMAAAVGILGGACLACALAPRAFLTGAVGKKWMKLIGTESVLGARLVCLLFGAITAGPLVAIIWMILTEK